MKRNKLFILSFFITIFSYGNSCDKYIKYYTAQQQAPTSSILNKTISVCNQSLVSHPVNTHFLYALGAAYQYKGEIEKSVSYFTKACDLGDAASCIELGIDYHFGIGTPAHLQKAALFYTKACDIGDQSACYNLAQSYQYGKGVSKNIKRSISLYQKACNAGNSHGCMQLGTLYRFGESNLTKKEDKAVELYEKACKLGEPKGCLELAECYQYGIGIEKDKEKATDFFMLSCEGEEMEACFKLGQSYEYGQGIDQDLERAIELYGLSCNHHYTDACAVLGTHIFHSKTSLGNPEKATTLYETACQGGNMLSCYRLAKSYARGDGISQDKTKAIALYKQTCQNNIPEGCRDLAALYLENNQSTENNKLIQKNYQRACMLGEESSCYQLGVLYESGEIFPKNLIQASQYYQKTCSFGNQTACDANTKVLKMMEKRHKGFTVDGLKSGMSLDLVLPQKYRQNRNGQYTVTQGKTTAEQEYVYGREQSGQYIAYSTKILGRTVNIYLWFTPISKQLYAARVLWDHNELSEDLIRDIENILFKKYGKSKEVLTSTLGESTVYQTIWEQEKQIRITFKRHKEHEKLTKVYINYLDLRLLIKKNNEQGELPQDTDKL